ncbi:MAG TPA: VOC family protein [Polyangiaceae bacterium]
MKNTPRFGFVVVYVSDLAKSKRFHTDVLGLRVEREAPTFVQFEHFALASDERLGEGNEPELYWLVDDVEAFARELGSDAPISRPLETKPFGEVLGVRAPEGGTRFVLELAANRAARRDFQVRERRARKKRCT